MNSQLASHRHYTHNMVNERYGPVTPAITNELRDEAYPLGMLRIHPRYPDSNLRDHVVVIDVLLPQEPEEEEDDDGRREDDDDDEGVNTGYSE